MPDLSDLKQKRRELNRKIRQYEELLHGDQRRAVTQREYAQQHNREASAAARDIGQIPPIASQSRRDERRCDLRRFLETYHPRKFSLSWSPSHLKLIDALERAVLEGTLQLIAYPRGSGKTSVARCAVEWAVLYGHRRFPMLFGAEASKSKQHIDSIKSDLLTNDLLLEDFPEVCYPVRQAEGIANRANYQTCRGEPTNLKWGGSHIIFPTVAESTERGNAGCIVGVGTITGSAARGPLINDTRPDFAFIDDPQTRSSAKSPQQCQERESIITADILGMAGPDKHMSAIMTATVIYKDDLAEKLLDRQKHPEWNGIRVAMLEKWPSNMEMWAQWQDIAAACMIDERPLDPAHDFYRENREAMDEGAEVYWDARITPGYVSALESAMALYYRDPLAFASEMQNQPIDVVEDQSGMPSVDEIVAKQHGFERGVIPDDAQHLVAMVDVQANVLYWLVSAWREDFSGYVIDYGTWPDQRRYYFSLADVQRTLYHECPGAGFEGALYHGLTALLGQLNGHRYRTRTGEPLPLSCGLVDAQYGKSTDTVYRVITELGSQQVWFPSHGMGYRATRKPFSDYSRKPGDRVGLNWRIPRLDVNARRVRHVLYETNWWKTMHAQRWRVPLNEPGSLSLWRWDKAKHRMFAEHLHGEYAVDVEANGRKVTEWNERVGSPDNHFLDLAVGCCVAASIAGCTPAGVNGERRRQRKKKALTRESLRQRGKG